MPDEPQNSIPAENPLPPSPQEPTIDASIPPIDSEPVVVPPETPESPREAESAIPVNNDNEQIEPTKAVPEQTAPTDAEAVADRQTDNPSLNQPISEAPTQLTAQIPVIEPFAKLSLLAKAREMIQFRKRRKLEKIMGMFLKQSSITNDEVEKLLHVSDATTTRYLEQLEKEGKIKQEGRTGKGVSYSRI